MLVGMLPGTQQPGPVALTIAGFDPSSGAGVTADLAVFAAHGIFGLSAITSLTVQSTVGVQRVDAVAADLLAQTLSCLQDDLPPAGIKIGMLGDEPQVAAVVAYLLSLPPDIPIVLDPVLQSTSGALLLSAGGRDLLERELVPLVHVITPNATELSLLAALPCNTDVEIRTAADSLSQRYDGLAILCTGGDRPQPDDLLLHNGVWTVLPGQHIETRATHGTGCALSSALLCGLLQGQDLVTAARNAKHYVAQAMQLATPRGAGKGPMHLLWPMTRHQL